MSGSREVYFVHQPFDNVSVPTCPVYNGWYVTLKKLVSMTYCALDEKQALQKASKYITKKIPGRQGRATNFVSIHDLPEFFALFPNLPDCFRHANIADSLTRDEQVAGKDDSNEIPIRKRPRDSGDFNSDHRKRPAEPPQWAIELRETMEKLISGQAVAEYTQTEEFRQRCKREVQLRALAKTLGQIM